MSGTDNSWEHTIKCDICRQAHTQSGMTLSNNRPAVVLAGHGGGSFNAVTVLKLGRKARKAIGQSVVWFEDASKKANPLPPQPETRNPREREARDSAGDHLGAP